MQVATGTLEVGSEPSAPAAQAVFKADTATDAAPKQVPALAHKLRYRCCIFISVLTDTCRTPLPGDRAEDDFGMQREID